MASQRAIETGIPNPTSVQPKHLDPLLFSTSTWKKEALGRRYLPASQYQPLFGAQERVVERCLLPPGSCKPDEWEGGGNSSNSCISANCCCCCIYTIGGCRESTVMTVGSAQLLRRQVPWIRKLGQAPRIGGEGCAPANQLPPRAPVSLRRTRGAAGPQEQSGWRPRPRTSARLDSHTHSHAPGARTWPPRAHKRSALMRKEGWSRLSPALPRPADHSPSCPLLAPHPAL